jgi:hypothetical protein
VQSKKTMAVVVAIAANVTATLAEHYTARTCAVLTTAVGAG